MPDKEVAVMYAPRIAKPQTKVLVDSTSRLAQRGSWLTVGGWRSWDQDKTRPPPLKSETSRVFHDFSKISVLSARQDAVQTTTIPFRAVIQASRQNTAGRSKTVHDEPTEEASAQREPKQPPPGQEAASTEAETSSPAEQDKNTLYIAQMGGPPGMKNTSGVADTVSAAFAYTPTTTHGGAVMAAGDFGDTQGSLKHFSNVSITAGTGTFTVTADLKQTVVWDTRADKGPDNQVNIMSETDAALTSANYPQVVADLTPDMTDLKGRPPRSKFWSKDLTEVHEKKHVKDFVDIAKTGATGAETWLGTQNAAKKEDVPALLDTAWSDKIFKVWDKFTDPPAVEERAYSDGAPLYKARADAIKAKGDKGAAGGYPPPP